MLDSGGTQASMRAAERILGRPLTLVTTPTPLKGRNLNLLVQDSSCQLYFIKRLRDGEGSARRVSTLEDAQERLSRIPLPTPGLIGIDPAQRLAVYEYSVGEPFPLVLKSGRDSDLLWADFGSALGKLHSGGTEGLPAMPSDAPRTGTDVLKEFSFEAFWSLSAAEVELWRILQKAAADGKVDLDPHEFPAEPVLVHFDLRLDQTLCVDDHVMLLDWEEMRSGDRARDLGMLFGDILSETVYGVLDNLDESDHAPDEAVGALMISAGRRARRAIGLVVDGYMSEFTSSCRVSELGHLNLLGRRVAHYMFRHLLERVGSRSAISTQLTGIDRGIVAIALESAQRLPAAANAFGFDFQARIQNA